MCAVLDYRWIKCESDLYLASDRRSTTAVRRTTELGCTTMLLLLLQNDAVGAPAANSTVGSANIQSLYTVVHSPSGHAGRQGVSIRLYEHTSNRTNLTRHLGSDNNLSSPGAYSQSVPLRETSHAMAYAVSHKGHTSPYCTTVSPARSHSHLCTYLCCDITVSQYSKETRAQWRSTVSITTSHSTSRTALPRKIDRIW